MDFQAAFRDDKPPETGAFLDPAEEGQQLAQQARERVLEAMSGFQERSAAGKVRERPERKKSSKTNLNEQCRKWMNAKGWKYSRVDYFDVHANVSHDLLGMFDFLAFDLESGASIGVQLTSKSNMAARRKKMLAEPRLEWVRACGWKAVVVGFQMGANGRYESKEDWIV